MQNILGDLEIQADSLILIRRPDLVIINKEKKLNTSRLVDYPVSTDYRMKVKENKKGEKYLDLARKLKKKKKSYRTISKGLERVLEEFEIRGRTETIQTTV